MTIGRRDILAGVGAVATQSLLASPIRAQALKVEKDELKFGFIKLTDMVPLAIAKEKGFFEDEGLLANAQWKPSLALMGNLMYQDDGLSNLWTSTNQSYTLGLALRVPLFAAPRAAAQRTVALAQRRQAGHGLQAALDAGHLEIASAWTDLEALAEVVVMQEKALELARESVSIAQVSYEHGVITSAELTDAQVALLQTESLLMQAKYHRIVAAARARFAAGIE